MERDGDAPVLLLAERSPNDGEYTRDRRRKHTVNERKGDAVMEREEALKIMDKLIDDSFCFMTKERWQEVKKALQVLVPESKFVRDDR